MTTWIEINKTAFEHNIMQFKRMIGAAQLGIVIKANAYGHGMLTIAQLAESNPHVSWYCVATLSEALKLRKHGFQKPTLTLGIIDAPLESALNKNIDISLYQHQVAQKLQAIGLAHNYIFNVHIKVDSGLFRLGVPLADAIEFIKKIKTFSHVNIKGLYSHFAESQKNDQSYTLEQINHFKKIIDALKELNISIPNIHMANSASAATTTLPFCTMVRVGAGTYGLWSSPDTQTRTHLKFPDVHLRPIICWKTKIMFIKNIPAQSFIGYDRTFRAPHNMRIAMLPMGYYEGYDFRLFNKAQVLVQNEYAPIIGRISMNITSIDITHIPQAQLEDEVIMMGDYPQLHPFELGMLAGNPNVREITTKINATIDRIIVDDLQLHNTRNFLYTSALCKDNAAI